MKNYETETIFPMQESAAFYKKILDSIPALVYINEFTKKGEPTSLRNVWSNRYALNFIGYSQEEINELGFDFFVKILHLDDLEIIKTTVSEATPFDPETAYTFLQRLRPKDKNEYSWMYGNGVMLEAFDKEYPKKSLNIVIPISNKMNTENQLVSALKEISYLKNNLRLCSLSKREKEMLRHIAQGHTDNEIGLMLSISPATAHTHRNKLIKKLGLKNSASLAFFAAECGLL